MEKNTFYGYKKTPLKRFKKTLNETLVKHPVIRIDFDVLS